MIVERPLQTRPRSGYEQEGAKHGIFWFFLLANAALILYLTLFPFDFVFADAPHPVEAVQHFNSEITAPYVIQDIPGNILLFIPFGFFCALLLDRLTVRRGLASCVVLAAGFLLSFSVELLQFYLLRFSAWMDLAANAAGAGAGLLIYRLLGERLLEWAFNWTGKIFRQIPAAGFAALLVLWTGFIPILTLTLADRSSLKSWDPAYPLLVGNEQTGDRPWQGVVSEIWIADRALKESEVKAYFSDPDRDVFSGSSLIANLAFTTFTDGTAQGGWILHGSPQLGEYGLHTAGDAWLEIDPAALPASSRIIETSAFTIGINLTSAAAEQWGPARILSLSASPYQRNFTAGQEGADLVIRLRTGLSEENGSRPEYIVPGVFSSSTPRRILIAFNGNDLRVYLDGPHNAYAFASIPQVNFFWIFPPAGVTRVRLNSQAVYIYRLLYAGLLFLPAGFISTAARRRAILSGVKVNWTATCALISTLLYGAALLFGGQEPGRVLLDIIFSLLFLRIAAWIAPKSGHDIVLQNTVGRSAV
jgi:glycopeptide antibiotics resistance protein